MVVVELLSWCDGCQDSVMVLSSHNDGRAHCPAHLMADVLCDGVEFAQ